MAVNKGYSVALKQQIKRLKENGETYTGIARILTEEGHTSSRGGKLYPSTVRWIYLEYLKELKGDKKPRLSVEDKKKQPKKKKIKARYSVTSNQCWVCFNQQKGQHFCAACSFSFHLIDFYHADGCKYCFQEIKLAKKMKKNGHEPRYPDGRLIENPLFMTQRI